MVSNWSSAFHVMQDTKLNQLNNSNRALFGAGTLPLDKGHSEPDRYPTLTPDNSVITTPTVSPGVKPEIADSIHKFVENALVTPKPFEDPTGPVSPSNKPDDTLIPPSIESEKDYDILEYFEGLLASQGAENEINRKYNSAEAMINREFQHNESKLQRDWYEYMSNSAYQRAVADMKKAGINPILAYQQGGAASAGTGTPAGSAAAYTATGGDTLSSLFSAAADLIGTVANVSAKKKADATAAVIKLLLGM